MTLRQLEELIKTKYGAEAYDFDIEIRVHIEDDFYWEDLDEDDVDIWEYSIRGKRIQIG